MNQRPDDDITNGWGLDLTRKDVAEAIPAGTLLAVLGCVFFVLWLSA